MSVLKKHWDKFRLDELCLYQNEFFVVALREIQKTPFSLILSAKKEIYRHSELTVEEFKLFQEAIVYVEDFCYTMVGATKINFVSLMMVDPILHYHIFPRFKDGIQVNGHDLVDIYYPKPVDILDHHRIELKIIKQYFQR